MKLLDIWSKFNGNQSKIEALKTLTVEEIENKALQEFYDLRKKWSNWIIIWIAGLLLFHIVIVFLVGFGILEFDIHFIQTLLIGDFIEITGMGFVVVKFLNSHKEKNNTKKITKKTNETHT